MDRALEESRYGPNEWPEIERVFGDAAQDGIGSALLLPRVQEANTKRVPAQRLVAALRLEIERFDTARDILLETGSGETLLLDDAAWQRTANLIAWGAKREEMEALASACREDPHTYLEASYLFTSLVEWGLEREASEQLVLTLIGSKISTAEYPGVIEVLIKGRRLKMRPIDIARRMIGVLGETDNLRQLERKVLNDR